MPRATISCDFGQVGRCAVAGREYQVVDADDEYYRERFRVA
jgi:hypothetical protein